MRRSRPSIPLTNDNQMVFVGKRPMSDVEAFHGALSPSVGGGDCVDRMRAPAKVMENLFLGSVEDAYDVEFLTRNNIKRVVVAARECMNDAMGPADPHHPAYEARTSMKVLELPLDDHSDAAIQEYFDEVFAFIDQARAAGEAVLVHCRVGVSRSATLVIGYYMRKQGATFDEAFLEVKRLRPLVSPNLGFCLELRDLEQRHAASNRVELVQTPQQLKPANHWLTAH